MVFAVAISVILYLVAAVPSSTSIITSCLRAWIWFINIKMLGWMPGGRGPLLLGSFEGTVSI